MFISEGRTWIDSYSLSGNFLRGLGQRTTKFAICQDIRVFGISKGWGTFEGTAENKAGSKGRSHHKEP